MQRWECSRLPSIAGMVDWALQGLEGMDTSESKDGSGFWLCFHSLTHMNMTGQENGQGK